MKVFFKHLLRTLLRAPVQPLLILLTVVASTAIAVTAFRLPFMFSSHLYEVYGREVELGDLTVLLRGDSDTRMLFSEDAEATVGEDGTVLGEFQLTGFYDGADGVRTLDLSAVDLTRADAFYQFHYLEYGEFTTQNLQSSTVISASLAGDLGLSVGDALTLRVLETEYTFVVQAVAADEGLLTETDLLVPITSLTHALSVRVPAIAALGDSFLPYTRLLIKANDPASLPAIAERLAASPSFSDKLVKTTDAEVKIHSQELIQTVSLWIPALLLLILTALLVATSLKLLQSGRRLEYGVFRACGATERQLASLQMGESLVYALIGGAGGVLLSAPLLRVTSLAYHWQTKPLTTGVSGAVFGLLWAVVFMVGSTLLHLHTVRRNEKRSGVRDGREVEPTRRGAGAAAFAVLILSALSIPIVPPTHRYLPCIAVLLSLVWCSYLAVSTALRGAAWLGTRLLSRNAHPLPSLWLSLKNLRVSAPLSQVARLSVLLFSLLLTIVTCTTVLARQSDQLEDFLVADTLVVNADETLEALTAELDGIDATLRFAYFSEVELDSGATVLGLSLAGDANACVHADMLPTKAPHAGEVAVSTGIASMEGVRVGDRLTVSVKGCRGDFTVSEIVDTNVSLVYFDAVALGMKNDTMCVLTDGTHDREALLSLVEPYGAAVMDADDIFGGLSKTMDGYLTLLDDAFIAALAVTLVGIVNLLCEQSRARREERAVLHLCGSTPHGVLRVAACELILIFLFAIALSIPLAFVMCRLVDLGARSFGMALFL